MVKHVPEGGFWDKGIATKSINICILGWTIDTDTRPSNLEDLANLSYDMVTPSRTPATQVDIKYMNSFLMTCFAVVVLARRGV